MSNKVYLIVGCPGAGKSWVADQVKSKFNLVQHDAFIGQSTQSYIDAIVDAAQQTDKPILIETPFSVSQIMEPLQAEGLDVEPVFIIEEPNVISMRYYNRESKDIPKGHLTRQNTYAARARALGAFAGTSKQVVEHLKKVSRIK